MAGSGSGSGAGHSKGFKYWKNKALDLGELLLGWGMRLLGIVMTCIATCCFSICTYAYFDTVLPALAAQHGIYVSCAATIFGLWLLFNLCFNYFSAMFVGPGHADAVGDLAMTPEVRGAQIHDPDLDRAPPGALYRSCVRCTDSVHLKPMRSHYCALCRKCVMKMDHHCPWINNCVGWRNQRYFLLFLVYLCWSSCFFLIAGFPQVAKTFSNDRNPPMAFLMASITSISASLASALFVVWNVVLVVTNQSTVEFYTYCMAKDPNKKNPFNLGSRRNFKEVFGHDATWLTWALPSRAPPPGNGLVYPMKVSGRVLYDHLLTRNPTKVRFDEEEEEEEALAALLV